MGDMTTNFSRSEFACKCGCGDDDISPLLVQKLQQLRDALCEIEGRDVSIHISSGVRCVDHNRRVGGSSRSQHIVRKAADCIVSGVDPHFVADLAKQFGFGGIGEYDSFTHLDVRPMPSTGPATW